MTEQRISLDLGGPIHRQYLGVFENRTARRLMRMRLLCRAYLTEWDRVVDFTVASTPSAAPPCRN
jgi:hypothetical protein